MESVVKAGAAEAVVVCDSDEETAAKAAAEVGCQQIETSFEAVLDHDVDGVVLATPSALHAGQALACLERGKAVFCQKPLARTTAETEAIVDMAERRNVLLGVDFSYRRVEAFAAARAAARSGRLGSVYALDLVFHNAYGPDKGWFLDPALSGGGCVIDLGTHLVDLAITTLEDEPLSVSANLFAGGERIVEATDRVEDYAVAELTMANGQVVRIACSWFLPIGRDAVIEAHIYGSRAAASVRNVHGSFYDFVASLYDGRSTTTLATPPDDWGGRALIDWARALETGAGFECEVRSSISVARTVDRIYGRLP